MSWTSQAKKYCSGICRNLARRDKFRLRDTELKEGIWKHKKSIGCQNCGYNEHGAALDWHHPNKDKDKGYHLTHYTYFNEIGRLERDKCILLCSNCHRVEHVRLTKIEHDQLINLIASRKREIE